MQWTKSTLTFTSEIKALAKSSHLNQLKMFKYWNWNEKDDKTVPSAFQEQQSQYEEESASWKSQQ